jgi:ABC-type dipeptide/oligopeptide/nickel transport system permease component
MSAYLLRRLAQSIVVIAVVVVLVFAMMFLSGDPAALLLPPDASREEIDAFRHEMGFDQPFWMQFVKFSGSLLVGDFGRSWRFHEPALSVVLERLPATFELAIAALSLSLLIAVPVGVISAVRKDSKVDTVSMVLALLGQSVPGFWLGLMLILIFAVDLGWLPTSGRNGPEYLVLPAVSLALALAGRNARLVRSCMLEVLNEDYIRTARAKGLSEWRVVGKHALKNAMLPIVTIVGLELGSLLGGAVVTETIFSWPGIGLLAVQAIAGRDYPVVQAVIIISALCFVLINLAVDLLYTRLDPRVALIRGQGA